MKYRNALPSATVAFSICGSAYSVAAGEEIDLPDVCDEFVARRGIRLVLVKAAQAEPEAEFVEPPPASEPQLGFQPPAESDAPQPTRAERKAARKAAEAAAKAAAEAPALASDDDTETPEA